MKPITSFISVVFLVISLSLSVTPSSFAGGSASGRPKTSEEPEFARWLLRTARWGVLSTLNSTTGVPFGNVMSYADPGTGVPLFFLTTTLDPTGAFAVADPRSSLTVSEIEVGTCDPEKTDPQSPACAKLTLSGELVRLPKKSNETMAALAAIYAAHPQFLGFPTSAGFEVFRMEIRRVFLVNDFKPSVDIDLGKYFAVE